MVKLGYLEESVDLLPFTTLPGHHGVGVVVRQFGLRVATSVDELSVAVHPLQQPRHLSIANGCPQLAHKFPVCQVFIMSSQVTAPWSYSAALHLALGTSALFSPPLHPGFSALPLPIAYIETLKKHKLVNMVCLDQI